jgi:hypothetical protein
LQSQLKIPVNFSFLAWKNLRISFEISLNYSRQSWHNTAARWQMSVLICMRNLLKKGKLSQLRM